MLKNIGLLLVTSILVASCDDLIQKEPESSRSKSDGIESNPTIGQLEVGGLPSEEETAALQEMSLDEAVDSAAKIKDSQGSLSLDLTADSSGVSLLEGGDECEGTFFCFAKAFADIYDMVTGAAQCNFDLILGDNPTPRQVPGHPVFYIDGWGTLALGEGGLQPCPARENVDKFVEKISNGEHEDDDEFFLPMRLVMFRKADGKVHWRMVFLPADNIKNVAQQVPVLSKLVDGDLDFQAFHGFHDISKEVGQGDGRVVINFDELGRMFSTLDSLDEDKASLVADDGGMPQGKIDITYDLSADPQKLVTVFRDKFSFGDGDSPFQSEVPTTILRSGGENYLHFFSNDSFVKEGDDPTSPFMMVQLCRDNANQFKYVKDVPQDQYLANPSTVHMQMIWKDLTGAETVPSQYVARITQTKGGAYIYGDTMFEGAQNGGSELSHLRIRAPLCEDLESELNNNGYAFLGHVPVGSDGFVNINIAQANKSGSPYLDSAAVLKLFPAFSTFKFVDPADPNDSPLGSSGAAVATNQAPPAAGYCTEKSGSCMEFKGLSFSNMGTMYNFCTAAERDESLPESVDQGPTGIAGTWSFKTACPADPSHTCSATNFDYGPWNIESVTSNFYGVSQIAGGNLCVQVSGTVSPPLVGSCNFTASKACIPATSTSVYANMASACTSWSGEWNGTTNVCSTTNLKGTCTANGLTWLVQSDATYLDQAWCEGTADGQQGGSWSAN